MEDIKFQREILDRLLVIETKLDDYTRLRDKTDKAYYLSHKNEQTIKELQEKNKFLSRTITTAVVAGIIEIVFILITLGMGVN